MADRPAGAWQVPAPRRLVVAAGDGCFLLSVYGVGLACCAVEVVVATVAEAGGVPADLPAGTPAAAVEVMVVAGTVTDRMAPALLALYDAMPEPRAVLSFGACANTGGPYWDSYSVTKGVDQLLPVDVWVPGCPPRPGALLEGLAALGRRPGGP